jgi:hypothetical protein
MSYYEQLLRRDKRIFLTPHDFLKAAVEYFEWAEETPLQEEKVFHHQGEITRTDVSKVRAFTKIGLANYLGIPVSRLDSYKAREDKGWAEVVEIIEQVIKEQKFINAAVGLMNATIISRDLGLAEKQEVETTDVTPPAAPETPSEHQAIHVHPDDTNPLNLPRPLYSQAQLDMGMPFVAPPHDTE